ncbi:rubisco lsmt substrate-binding protein [Acanthamoeba castellanii str. Neff]|uniref:Rubisco lsmt substrate-binding protein n=1 Tax=Acanthamoeba castellanii (strain ATCC 30010 / Neff) TaxID=1257118 RepID=L8HLI7_ACACF|nr:rubisco lsmt substrate-binding protein [Acanthamoeba castellanii str. Neff]ELR25271.1 rubisco lsmt substrate-binding protein [Acanthamoeba castellanii str. Neff]
MVLASERILEVPFSLLLDAGAALRAEDVGSVFAAVKPALDAVDNRLPLALFMLHELRKPDSFWRPYFDALPSRVNLPMFWADEDMQLLAGSPLHAAVLAQKKQARDWHTEHIVPIVRRYPRPFGVSDDDSSLEPSYSLARFEWVLSMIASRAFWHFDLKDTWEPHMVPMADLINHSLTNDNVSKYTFDDKTQTFIVHVQQPYAEGEQVFITYCTDSNFELLKTYAMMVEDNYNKYTEIRLDETTIARICPDEVERLTKTRALTQRGLAKQTYPVKSEEFPLDLVQALRLYHLPLTDSHTESTCFETDPVSVQNELMVYDTIAGCVKELLSQYPITAQEDAAMLAHDPRLSATARLAVAYRREDKLFLTEVGSVFAEMRKELDASADAPPLIMELFFDCIASVREQHLA